MKLANSREIRNVMNGAFMFSKKFCYQGIRRKDYSYNKKFLINHNTNTEWRCQVFWSISAAFSYLTASIHFGSKWVEQKIKKCYNLALFLSFFRQTSIFLFSNFQKSISFFPSRLLKCTKNIYKCLDQIMMLNICFQK